MNAPVRKGPKVIDYSNDEKNRIEEEILISQAILKAMAESAKAVKASKQYDFSCVTSLFGEEK